LKDIWANLDYDELEAVRDEKRKKSLFLTFDCYNTRAYGDRVECAKGRRLQNNSYDGSMGLMGVLRGTTSSACRSCQYYEGD